MSENTPSRHLRELELVLTGFILDSSRPGSLLGKMFSQALDTHARYA
jgi:hypothetical protein